MSPTEIQTLENPAIESNTSLVKSTTYGSNIVPDGPRTVRSPNESKGVPELCIVNMSQAVQQSGSGGKGNEQAVSLPLGLLLPPIITHTAATPQGSPPSSALDSVAFYLQDNADQTSDRSSLNRSSFSVNLVTVPVESGPPHHKSMVGNQRLALPLN